MGGFLHSVSEVMSEGQENSWNVSDHHDTKAQVGGEGGRPWFLPTSAKGASIEILFHHVSLRDGHDPSPLHACGSRLNRKPARTNPGELVPELGVLLNRLLMIGDLLVRREILNRLVNLLLDLVGNRALDSFSPGRFLSGAGRTFSWAAVGSRSRSRWKLGVRWIVKRAGIG